VGFLTSESTQGELQGEHDKGTHNVAKGVQSVCIYKTLQKVVLRVYSGLQIIDRESRAQRD